MEVAISSIKKTLVMTRTIVKKTIAMIVKMIHNYEAASKRRKAEKEIKQQTQLLEYKKSNRKINCPSCRNNISINAVACPKCGQPITDMARIDEIARTNMNRIIVVAVIVVFISLGLIGKLLPERPVSNSSNSYSSEELATKKVSKTTTTTSDYDRCYARGQAVAAVYVANIQQAVDVDYSPSQFMSDACYKIASEISPDSYTKCVDECIAGFKSETSYILKNDKLSID
jgi:hypothetical protein